jgi:preprotein translocase subunit SecE
MSAAAIYKPGQGYWTRMMSAIGAGVLVLSACAWVYGQFQGARWRRTDPNTGELVTILDTVYIQAIALLPVLLLGGILIYWIFGRKQRTVDFFIATEGEMRKVNWSTKKEVLGSTWVVIGVSVIIAAILFVADLLFANFFRLIGVLD